MNESDDRGNPNQQNDQPSPLAADAIPATEDISKRDKPNDPKANGGGKNGGFTKWVEHLWSRDPDRQLELILALSIAIFALCQLVVTVINNYSTSAQVDKIITAAGSIKDSAGEIKNAGWVFSGAAQGINNAGWNAVGRLQDQVDQVKRSADATKSAADTAKQTLEVQNRPWIAASIAQKGPLHFGSGGAGMDLQLRLKNFGHTPSIDTRYHASIVFLPQKTWAAVEIRDAEKKECDSFPQYFFAGSPQFLPAIFPNEEPSPEWPATIAAQGLRDAIASKSKGPFRHDGYVSLYLVACVVYRTSYSPDLHRSAYGFDLGIPQDPGIWMGDLKPEGTQPDVRLIFMDSFAD